MTVSIILVNYNTCGLTLQCLESIFKFSKKDLDFEVIVVDNDSKDTSIEILSKDTRITFIQSGANIGFGRANNLGVTLARGKYLWFLNTDTILLEDTLSQMLNFFKSYDDALRIGALGCVLVNEDLKKADSSFAFTSSFGVIKEILRLPRKTTMVNMGKIDASKVDYVSGASMMMLKSIFLDVGGFDKDFFMYFEEADLQRRIQKKGLNSYLFNGAKVVHFEGGSSDTENRLSNRRRIMIQQGRNLFLRKNDSKYYIFYVLFDVGYTFLRFLNANYTFKENYRFLVQNFKSYY